MYFAFDELKKISDDVYSGKRIKWGEDALKILFRNGFNLRKDDGVLVQINFSIPTSKENSFVLGLRYIKKDETFTEDHFLFEKNQPIRAYYRGKLELLLKEYKGTHKEQILRVY